MYGFIVTVKLAVTLEAYKQLAVLIYTLSWNLFRNTHNMVRMCIILEEAVTNRNDLKKQLCRQILRKSWFVHFVLNFNFVLVDYILPVFGLD